MIVYTPTNPISERRPISPVRREISSDSEEVEFEKMRLLVRSVTYFVFGLPSSFRRVRTAITCNCTGEMTAAAADDTDSYDIYSTTNLSRGLFGVTLHRLRSPPWTSHFVPKPTSSNKLLILLTS